MTEINKAKNFYNLMCLAGFLIILLPVGIANFIFGYMLGDSPCTLCWAQRESMIFIGVVALFIFRYGMKGKYIALLLFMAAFGLYQSFAHYGNHAHRDLDQGFALPIFGIHTYFWAEIVFWSVVVLLGVLFLFAPKFSAFDEEMANKKVRDLGGFSLGAFVISAIIIASNTFQALVATGIPPYSGQGDPVRFSLNPKFITWSTDGWNGLWQNISFLGKRDVKSPDYAFAPNGQQLGITFDHDSKNSPFAEINHNLAITENTKINIEKPLNSIVLINNEFVVSSKYDVLFLNRELEVQGEFEIDPYFSATIDPIIGIIPYLGDKYLLMGSNKSYLRFGKNDNADESYQFADFIRGYDKFEGRGDGLGRGRIDTVRSKFHHVSSMTNDSKYFYMATVPNNQDKKTFVISQFALGDRILSAEFIPHANLKEGRNLGELYVSAMTMYKDNLYLLSKNYNVIAVVDPRTQEVITTLSFPEEIKNARGLYFDEDDSLNILSYQDGSNMLYKLQEAQIQN